MKIIQHKDDGSGKIEFSEEEIKIIAEKKCLLFEPVMLKHFVNSLVSVASSSQGVPMATLALGTKNLIFFNPSTGTGTHIFSNVTSSYGNTVYTVVIAHATRSFRINNDISGVYVWRGLTRTIQPGGCITFATNADASKIYEINSVSAASHS